jgi:ABC-2 type transport system ATP-binding protein
MIEFDGITKKFKYNFWEKEFLALDNVSFQIKSGDLVGFLGANGAGKTTLIKILMDFSRQDSGVVKFSADFGSTSSEIHSRIGYLPEKAYLYPHLTGEEFLQYIGALHNISNDRLRPLIDEWAKRLQIDHALNRHIRGYSKGMQQRLGFVSSLIHNPKFLVLDEPLSGLDPIGRQDFKRILTELNQSGVTIFFSSHVVADVEEICNKVVFIEKGKLIYEGSIDELILRNSNDLYNIKIFKDNRLDIMAGIKEEDKVKIIQDLLVKNINIVEIEKDKLTLEEIIYKIKR